MPKFYFDSENAISQDELAIIAPKSVEEPISLLLEDILFLELSEPPSQGEISRHGFHTPKHMAHQTSVQLSKPPTHSFDKNTEKQDKISISEEVSKEYSTLFREQPQNEHQSNVAQDFQSQPLSKEQLTTQTVALTHDNEKTHANVLPPALVKHHYEIAAHLLKQGYVDTHQAIKKNATLLFNMMLSDLTQHMSDYIHSPLKSTLFKIGGLLKTMELFSEHSGDICYVQDLKPITSTHSPTYTPLSVILKLYASLAPDTELMSKLRKTAEHIALIDTSESQYLHAKYLLHMFPTGKTYALAVSEDESISFESQGSYALFTTKILKDSLVAFSSKLQSEQAPLLEQNVFNKLVDIFSQANNCCEKRVLGETADELNALYHQDATILLPCGWQGHCVDIALSKLQSTYLYANSGEPSYYNDFSYSTSGDTFRTLTEPSLIGTTFFHEVLTNSHKHFEQALLNQYKISSPVEIIEKPMQTFETCALDSHRVAIEGLLIIELHNQQVAPNTIKALAHDLYQKWDNFNAGFIIDAYMNNKPSLPAQALQDIQQSLLAQNDRPSSKLSLAKISQALDHPLYQAEPHEVASNQSHLPNSEAPASVTTPHLCGMQSSLEPIIMLPEPVFAC